ncbi:NAD+ synthase [Alkalibacterium putridalgicola]|jgi:NAD+ synthase|uniref:NH(3)-dependent NAD(+) synthetase n=1 Tax=Alkalibacterium putridalgicola TaxID=426703 RepID=A0A1H7U800_9LACT|nr:NH(3)-dependent NAD(+) synthetase [Alkalibacterium putridalgicola]SEL92768.1 NAD+ synthase [Alkalibacterium putridalgicola]
MISDLQKKIVEEMHVSPTIDPEKEIRRSIDFMKAYMKKHPFLKSFVLGISGGQDSTLLGKLAQMAVEELREETGNQDYLFIAVRLPYGVQADEADAMDAIEWMQPDKVMRVDIKPSVDATEKSVEANLLTLSDFNKGNIKARERMIIQYAIAGDTSGVVLGTDHSAESVTGFYTKYGDGGTDINPLFRLNKRQGKQLLIELNAPEHLVEKVPTADLESDKPGIADEVALGVTYHDIDDYLEGKEISEESAKKIEQWYLQTRHKRHLPVTVFDEFWK